MPALILLNLKPLNLHRIRYMLYYMYRTAHPMLMKQLMGRAAFSAAKYAKL